MLANEIVDAISNEIAEGLLGPGEKLPSPEEMQMKFGVGMSSVREALRILEGMGFVKVKKGRGGGAFVTSFADRTANRNFSGAVKVGTWNLLDFLHYRKLLDPGVIGLACANHTEKHIERLNIALEAVSAVPLSKETFTGQTTEFFCALASATGNPFVNAHYLGMAQMMDHAAELIFDIKKCVEISVHFYQQIMTAVQEGNAAEGALVGEAFLLQLQSYVKENEKSRLAGARQGKVIKWGVIVDLSGPTASHGNESVMGMMDAARVINENGGILGHRLELVLHNSGYNLSGAAKAYKELIKIPGLTGIYIQATGSTIPLAPIATKDKTLLFTSALSDKLSNPAIYPYHFSLGPTYADMAMICLKHIRDTWKDIKRNPRLVFVYPDNAYGRDPLDLAKPYAAQIGVEIGPDRIINWPTLDATPQLTSIAKFDPDYVYVTSTAMHAAAILRDAKRIGLRAQFILNIRSFNEELPRLAMGAAEGVMGIQAIAPYGSDVPGMKRIVQAHDQWHTFHMPTIAYVEGWANVIVPMEGCKIAIEAGKLTTEGISEALETLSRFDLGGIMAPISYTPVDHRGCTKARIFRIEQEKMVQVTGYISV